MFLPLLGGVARGAASVGSRMAGGMLAGGLVGMGEGGMLRGISSVASRAAANGASQRQIANYAARVARTGMIANPAGRVASTAAAENVILDGVGSSNVGSSGGNILNRIIDMGERLAETFDEPVDSLAGMRGPEAVMTGAATAGTLVGLVDFVRGGIKRMHNTPMLEAIEDAPEDADMGDRRREYFRNRAANNKRRNIAKQIADYHDDRSHLEDLDESSSNMVVEENGAIYLPGLVYPGRIIRIIQEEGDFEWIHV